MSRLFALTPYSRVTFAIAVAIGLAILLRLSLIGASLEMVPVTSDEASVVIQAKEIAQGKFSLLFLGQPLLFPVEAYTMAPLVEWLPRNTLSARYQTWVLGCISVLGFLLLARATLAKNARWPAYLLILFPSSYLLLLTSGYSPPQYPTSLTLAWVSLLLVFRYRQRPRISLLGMAGAACGLAISNHLLFLPVALGVVFLIVFGGNFKKGLSGLLPFTLGTCLGLIPLLAAILTIPGAYQGFLPPQSLHDSFDNLLRFVLSESLAGAMGMYPTLFPDLHDARLLWIEEVRLLFTIGYAVLCGYLLKLRFSALTRNLREKTWPQFELIDAVLLIIPLTILIFASHDNEWFAFRYLLHAVWCFPFLIGYAYATGSSRTKQCIAAVTICFVAFNIACSAKMIRQWRKPGRISTVAELPPIAPLLHTLSSMHVKHCYASFWLAYRISFESDEEIKCTGPYNERFPRWPMPYKQGADEDEKAAYVLTQTAWARLPALEFEANTAAQGIGYERIEVGDRLAPFHIYHRFIESDQGQQRLAALAETVDCRGPGDPCRDEAWGDEQPLWHISLTGPHTLTRLSLQELPLLADVEGNLRLVVRDQGRWRRLENGTDYNFLRLSFAHGHPLYHDSYHLIRFRDTTADALRIGLSQNFPPLSGHSPTFTLYARP